MQALEGSAIPGGIKKTKAQPLQEPIREDTGF